MSTQHSDLATPPSPSHVEEGGESRPSSPGAQSSSSTEVVVVESHVEGEEQQQPVTTDKESSDPSTTSTQEGQKLAASSLQDVSIQSSIPEETTIPTPQPPQPVTPKSTAAAKKISVSYLLKINTLVTRLNRLLSNETGKDRALMVLSYSITALTAHMDHISTLRSLAHSREVEKLSVIPVGVSSYLIFSRPKDSSRLYALSTRLKALAALISDVRIFLRLWGLLGIWEWGVSVATNPPKDKTLRRIAYAQVVVNVLYQILENLAYLGQHKVLPVGKKKQNAYWLWSSRLWMMHVILEFWRLKRDREVGLKGKEKEKEGERTKWYDVKGVLKGQSSDCVWMRQLWSNMAYAPLTVHWSLENGALSPLSVGTLGTIAGLIGLQQAWRNTA